MKDPPPPSRRAHFARQEVWRATKAERAEAQTPASLRLAGASNSAEAATLLSRRRMATARLRRTSEGGRMKAEGARVAQAASLRCRKERCTRVAARLIAPETCSESQ